MHGGSQRIRRPWPPGKPNESVQAKDSAHMGPPNNIAEMRRLPLAEFASLSQPNRGSLHVFHSTCLLLWFHPIPPPPPPASYCSLRCRVLAARSRLLFSPQIKSCLLSLRCRLRLFLRCFFFLQHFLLLSFCKKEKSALRVAR